VKRCWWGGFSGETDVSFGDWEKCSGVQSRRVDPLAADVRNAPLPGRNFFLAVATKRACRFWPQRVGFIEIAERNSDLKRSEIAADAGDFSHRRTGSWQIADQGRLPSGPLGKLPGGVMVAQQILILLV